VSITRPDVLFYLDAARGVRPTIGSRPTFTRSGIAYYLNGESIYIPVGHDVPREAEKVWDPVAGEFRRAIGLAMSQTNLVLHSNDFTQTEWVPNAELTVTPLNSGIFEQEDGTLLVGYNISSDGTVGSRSIRQAIGTLSSGPETFSDIVRHVDAPEFAIGIRDTTTSQWVALGGFDWVNGELTHQGIGPQQAGTQESIGVEDLGGGFFRAWVSALPDNPGNNRSVLIYPVEFDALAASADVFHAQHVLEPFPGVPIVTGASAATQEVERLKYDSAQEAMLVYTSWVERGTFLSGKALETIMFGHGEVGTLPRWIPLGKAPVVGQLRTLYTPVSGSVNSALQLDPEMGDLVECLSVLRADGTVQIAARKNGGGVVAGSASTSPDGLVTDWPELHIGGNGTDRDSIEDFLAVEIVKEAAPAGQATLDAELMDEMRDLTLSPDGSLIDDGAP